VQSLAGVQGDEAHTVKMSLDIDKGHVLALDGFIDPINGDGSEVLVWMQ